MFTRAAAPKMCGLWVKGSGSEIRNRVDHKQHIMSYAGEGENNLLHYQDAGNTTERSFLVWIILLLSCFAVIFLSYGHRRATNHLLSQNNNDYKDNHRQPHSRGGRDQFGLATNEVQYNLESCYGN